MIRNPRPNFRPAPGGRGGMMNPSRIPNQQNFSNNGMWGTGGEIMRNQAPQPQFNPQMNRPSRGVGRQMSMRPMMRSSPPPSMPRTQQYPQPSPQRAMMRPMTQPLPRQMMGQPMGPPPRVSRQPSPPRPQSYRMPPPIQWQQQTQPQPRYRSPVRTSPSRQFYRPQLDQSSPIQTVPSFNSRMSHQQRWEANLRQSSGKRQNPQKSWSFETESPKRSSEFENSRNQRLEEEFPGFLQYAVDATAEQACQLLAGQPHGTYLIHRIPTVVAGRPGFDAVVISVVMHDEILSNYGFICRPEEFRPNSNMHERWRRFHGWLTISEAPWDEDPIELNSGGGLFRDPAHMSLVFHFLRSPCSTEGFLPDALPSPRSTGGNSGVRSIHLSHRNNQTRSDPVFSSTRQMPLYSTSASSNRSRSVNSDSYGYSPQPPPYSPPDPYQQKVGVGLDLNRLSEGTLYVVSLQPGSTAEQCNIVRPGDIILKINGESVVTMSDEILKRKVAGPPGSHIILTCRRSDRSGGDVLFDATLIRGRIDS